MKLRPTPTHFTPSMAAAVIEALERHGQPRMTIGRVAAEFGISVRMLQIALAEDNTNFRSIRRRCQVHDAITLLTATELSIAEVARRAGYTNQANFYRAFSAVTGTTPARFRRGRQAG